MALILLFLLIVASCFPVVYVLSPASKARRSARETVFTVEALVRGIQEQDQALQSAIVREASSYGAEIRTSRLKAIPIEELKRHGTGLRLQALKDTGIHNLADLQGWSTGRLEHVRGVGPKSAAMIAHIVSSLTSQSNAQSLPHPAGPFALNRERNLCQAIYHMRQFQTQISIRSQTLHEVCQDLATRKDKIVSETSFAKWMWGWGSTDGVQAAISAALTLTRELDGSHTTARLFREVSESLAKLQSESRSSLDSRILIEDFEANREEYSAQFTKHLGISTEPTPPEAILAHKKPVAPTRPVPVPMIGTTSVNPVSVQFSISIQKPPNTVFTKPALPVMSDLWIPPDRVVHVQGFLIRGGTIYLGGTDATASGHRTDPSLIDPYKQIAKSSANCHIRHTGYWPSYDQITPEARASYLQWLATGKCDPQADIGYVFLYFYGLERRVLVDMASDPNAKADLPHIEAEVRRLLNIYSSNGSFRSYAGSLLDFIVAKNGAGPLRDTFAELPTRSQPRISLELKLMLGQHSRDGKPLSPSLALAWYLSAPDIRFGQSVRICPDQFAELFKIQFANAFPLGIKLPANKTRIKILHRPASAILGSMDCSQELDLPDVTVLRSALSSLTSIGDSCNALLAPYCRQRIADPEGNDPLGASIRLPVSLWPAMHRKSLEDLHASLMGTAKSRILTVEELLLLLPFSGEINRDRFKGLTQRLSEIGLGLEPDLRFGGELPGIHNRVALFDLADSAPDQSPSTGFASAGLILQMASTVATADSSFDEAEASVMLHQIHHQLGLPVAERNRLAARLELYRFAPPTNAGIKRRIEGLDLNVRNHVGDLLVQVALADGVIAPQEVKVLEGLFALMGLDQSSLYGKLNSIRSQLASAPPLLHPSAELQEPAQAVSKPVGIHFDSAKIALLRADTARVSALLGSVFREEQEAEPAFESGDDGHIHTEPFLLGLDTDHAELLRVLLERPQWSRVEVEELCLDRGLMTDGAIEQINDAAFQQFDCALIEGEDMIEVNSQLLDQPSSEEVV
jgi:uncharacterized tellurite resistance protein B-like protein